MRRMRQPALDRDGAAEPALRRRLLEDGAAVRRDQARGLGNRLGLHRPERVPFLRPDQHVVLAQTVGYAPKK